MVTVREYARVYESVSEFLKDPNHSTRELMDIICHVLENRWKNDIRNMIRSGSGYDWSMFVEDQDGQVNFFNYAAGFR